MKKINNAKSKLTVAILFVIAVCCATLAFLPWKKNTKLVEAERITIVSDVFADAYNLNAEVDFPAEIQITHNGKTVTASNGILVYPDGSIAYLGAIKLEKLGDYTVRYFFEDDNGNKCIAEKSFTVSNKMYGISTENGSVTAVSAEEQAGKSFAGNDENVLYSKEDGLIVRLGEGDTFQYTQSIDLTQVGEDGLCNILSLDYRMTDFVPNPNYNIEDTANNWKQLMAQSKIARFCVVRLSDSYDPGKYVEFYCRYDGPTNDSLDINAADALKSNYYASFTAAAVGQSRTGLTPPISKEYATYYNITLDGEQYGLYIKNEKGGTSFSGLPLTGAHTPFTWKYDYQTNKVYIQQGNKVMPVSALSSSEIYGTETFEGFTNGKVKLSVYMSEYVAGSQARVDITSIGDMSGKELVENFGKLGFLDTIASPVINLGVEASDERGIYVPLGTEYTLPVPTVVSSEEIVSSAVYAYANYGTATELDVPIVNGKLKIDKERRYTVKYVVKNAAGCVSEAYLVVNPVNADTGITLTTDYSGFEKMSAGAKTVLPAYSLQTINSTAALGVRITAVHEKETLTVDETTRTFVPKYAGEYKIVYECYDNVFTERKEFTVVCEASANVALIGDFVLPRYFMKDAEYSLANVPAYSFENGEPTELATNAYISYDNGQTYQAINTAKVKITGSDTAIVKYTAEKGASVAEMISQPVKIVDVGYGEKKALRLRDYFVHDGFAVKSYEETQNTDIRYDFLETEGSGKLSFVNAIDYTSLNFTFKIPTAYAGYGKVNVILTDYYDSSIQYTITYLQNGTLCYVSRNGEKSIKSSYAFADNSAMKKLTYDVLNKKLTVNDVTYNEDLASFFTSSLCYIDIEIAEVNGAASIIIDGLNGQNFRNNRTEDNVAPRLSLEDFSGEYELGSVITITVPCVTDVLSTVLNGNISLYAEKDGEVLYSLDGVALDGYCDPLREYQIKLDSFGQYSISFSALDGAGKPVSKICFVAVVDLTAPEIQINGSETVNLRQGKLFKLDYTVTDDRTAAENVVVTVFMRDTKSNAFYTFNEPKIPFYYAGKYEVYVYAKDESGNYSYKVIWVTVE